MRPIITPLSTIHAQVFRSFRISVIKRGVGNPDELCEDLYLGPECPLPHQDRRLRQTAPRHSGITG